MACVSMSFVTKLWLLLLLARQCLTWEEPLDFEEALVADLAEDVAGHDVLNLLQATAKLHHRGHGTDLPELGRGGGSLAAAIDSESEVPGLVSLVQASAEHRGKVGRSKSAKAKQEL